MGRFREVLEEMASELAFDTYEDFRRSCYFEKDADDFNNEAVKRYVTECFTATLKQASINAKWKTMSTEDSINDAISHNYGEYICVDEKSILSEDNFVIL